MDQHRVTINLDSIESIIRSKTDSFTAAHVSGETAYINKSFANDARIFPPKREIVRGKTAIAELNAEWVSYDIHEFVETSTMFYGNSDFVVDEGIYKMKFGEESTVDEGKYVNIWKLEKGHWRIYSNIWNASKNENDK
jgi:ketosteroid isomerase-like protein